MLSHRSPPQPDTATVRIPSKKPPIIAPASPRTKVRQEIWRLENRELFVRESFKTIINNKFLSSILGLGDLRVQAATTILEHSRKLAVVDM
jgi:hypothetical protein